MDDERGSKGGALMLPTLLVYIYTVIIVCTYHDGIARVSHTHTHTQSIYIPRVASLLLQKKLKYLVLEEKVKSRARLGLGPAGASASLLVFFGWLVVGW